MDVVTPGVVPDTIPYLVRVMIIMTPAELLREITYPFRHMAIVMAMFFFWLIFAIAKMAMSSVSIVVALLGLFLIIFISPAYFRYLLYLLEARANDKEAPVASAEIFSFTENLWSLTPIILVALLVWGGYFVSGYGIMWLSLYVVVFLIVSPASLAILAVTHSPIESLNPVAIARMFRICGPSYFSVPIIVGVLAFLLVLLYSARGTGFILELSAGYLTFLMFSLTGGVLRSNDVTVHVDIGPPLEPGKKEIAGELEKERQKVASHAYGFISRGNREGGFAHIMDWIQKEPDVHEASAWFFKTMMKWESKDPALFYAQIYIAHLLHHGEDMKALKLVASCLHEDPRWKPKVEDRQHVLELAEKHQRDDLVSLLRN